MSAITDFLITASQLIVGVMLITLGVERRHANGWWLLILCGLLQVWATLRLRL